MPKIKEILSSQSKILPKQKYIKNFSYASLDSKENNTIEPINTINTINSDVFQRNNKKKPKTFTSKINLLGSKNQGTNFTTEENNEITIIKLKKENFHLEQIIISKDKELENLHAINKQIIKGQESKNDVNFLN